MLEVIKYIFGDFWRFLQFCVVLMIVALWKPIEINIFTGKWSDKDNDD